MSQPRTVLLVDGDMDSRTVNRAMLQHYGYRVLEAADGVTAVKLAAAEPPDAVVTELSVPKLSGLELMERLRESESTNEVRLVVLSALTMESDIQRAYAAGCELFMSKPIEPQALVRELDRLLIAR